MQRADPLVSYACVQKIPVAAAAAPDLTPLFITRYLAAVGVTALVYYAVLTFPKEIDYIWKGRRWDATNICFMWNRYSSLAGLIYGAYLTSGLHPDFSDRICKVSYVAVTSVAIIAIASAHGFLAMFMWARWEHRTSAKWGMWISFLVTFAGLFASFVLGAKSIYDSTSWVPLLHVCALGQNPKPLAGVWISTLTFDLITGVLLILNALSQPYRQRSQVLERVRRDGALCFIVITVGSFVMLVIGFTGGTNGTFEAAFLVWSCDAIVVSWLSLEVGARDYDQDRDGAGYDYDYDSGAALPGAYELGVRKGKGGNL